MEKKTLILSNEVLEEVEISLKEFLYLYYLYSGHNNGFSYEDIDIDRLEKKKLLKQSQDKQNIILRQDSIDLIEFSLLEMDISFKKNQKKIKKSSRIINKEIEERVNEFRQKWKGLKPGSMGSLKACKEKLARWMKENPEYTFDEILRAADLYIKNEGKNIKFLQRADYFIYKQDSHKIDASRLSAYIDDIDMEEDDDWTSQLN